jgi:uncharacterized protein (DUF2141 family)
MKRTALFLLTILYPSLAAPAAAAPGKLVVTVTGLHSDGGQLLLRLYAGPDGYPTDGAKAVRQIRQRIAGGQATLELTGLAAGSYAIGCVHDENGNGKLDTNLLGIPKEGVCASNDAKGRMGPPRWEDARFSLGPDGAALVIHVRY